MHLLMIKSRKTNTPPTCLYESPHFHSQYDQEIKAFAGLANINLDVRNAQQKIKGLVARLESERILFQKICFLFLVASNYQDV